MISERKRGKWLTIAVVLVLFAAVAILIWPYSAKEFNGDGTIEDHGFWSPPPRYEIKFSPISLTTPGTYEFQFSGVPATRLYLSMAIVGSADESLVKSVHTHVDLSLTEADGRPVASFSAPLSDWELNWIPTERSGAFYDSSLSSLKLNRRGSYTLKIKVSKIDQKSPQLEVQPKFSGGGIETP